MAITLNTERQYPLVAEASFVLADLTSGAATAAVELPVGAEVIGGDLIIDTVFNSGTSDTFVVGDSGVANRYANAVDGQSAARTALTVTGARMTAKTDVTVTCTRVGTAATTGAGRLRVMYIVHGRGNENQG